MTHPERPARERKCKHNPSWPYCKDPRYYFRCEFCGVVMTYGLKAEQFREHIESAECWCEPELIGDHESEGGAKHYLHREIQ